MFQASIIFCALTTPFQQTVFIQQISWALSTGLVIQATLVFYVRIFPNRWMRKAIFVLSAGDTLWTLSTLLVTILQCNPVDFLWNRKIQGGKCIDSIAFYFACGLTSTVTVITALSLPLPIVGRSKVSTSEKSGLTISFTMGALYVTLARNLGDIRRYC